ncbi:unnamed protein product [Closterium sp. NIES-53]
MAIFDLDFDAILSAMYALSVSAEGDCYRCVPPDPGIAAAALGASECGTLPGTAPADVRGPLSEGLGFESRCMHFGPPSAGGCQRSTGSSLYTLTTEPSQVAASAQVSASGQVAASCSCRLLSHLTLLWHHRLDHPSLPRLHGMHSRLLVSGLPRSLPPLPPSLAPPCLPCVEGRQRAAPHSSLFPPTTAPLQTLHMDILQLREQFGQHLLVLCLHSDRGSEFSSNLLRDFCRGEGILQSFMLPDSPQQSGIAERRIGLVMEVARTSMIHVAAPHFLWPFAVWYAAHQLNVRPCVSLPETSPTLRWTREVGDASVFRVLGSLLPPHLAPFLPFSGRHVLCLFPSPVPFYRLFPYRSAPPPPPPLFLAPGPPPVDPFPHQGPAPSGC